MSNIKKNLGHVTAYAYYKAGGGTMTEEEFTEYMADFGDAAERAVDAASEAATSEANAASSATAAANSAAAALISEENANGAMMSAYSDANRADTAADTATSAKNDAVSAKTSAETAASTATTKASEAAASATTASTAASTATTKAGEAATSATNAAASAQSVASSAAQITQNAEDIDALKEDLIFIGVSEIFKEWEQGTIGYQDGSESASTTACRTVGYFIPNKSASFAIYNPNNQTFGFRHYDANGSFLEGYGVNTLKTIDVIANHKYRMVCASTGTPANVTTKFYFTADNSFDAVNNTLEKAISPKADYSLSYVDARPDNLINPDELITGYYIDNNGRPAVNSAWNCTGFIDIGEVDHLYSQNIGLGAYYDENKTYISSITLGSSGDDRPASAKYIRVSITPANVETAIICPHNFYLNFAQDAPVSVWKSPKKGYESGYIRFTVPVNNTVASYNDTAETDHEGTPDYVDVDCILSLPYKYKPVGVPCKLLMMCHGAGKGISGDGNWTTVSTYNTLVSLFTSRGYAVFDCNGFKNDALGWSFWGNQRGIEVWRKAYLYITNNYNVEKTFSIYAFSMGGLTAMNLAFQGFPNINAIAMGSPVLDLHEVWNSTDGTKAVLKVLYGLGDDWDESKVVGNNPYKHVMTLNGVDYCPYKLPPIKIWYGSTETNNTGNPAIEKEIAKSFVNAIVNSGGYAYYREVSGRGHEICYGGSSVVNNEILTYLERYERAEATFY